MSPFLFFNGPHQGTGAMSQPKGSNPQFAWEFDKWLAVDIAINEDGWSSAVRLWLQIHKKHEENFTALDIQFPKSVQASSYPIMANLYKFLKLHFFIIIPRLTIFRHTYCLLYTDWLKHAITRKKPNPEWSGDGKPRIHICSKFLAQESRQRKVGIVDFRLSMSYQPSDKYAINRMAGLPLEKAVRLLFILKLKAWH